MPRREARHVASFQRPQLVLSTRSNEVSARLSVLSTIYELTKQILVRNPDQNPRLDGVN